MNTELSRRTFLRSGTLATGAAACGTLEFLARLPAVAAAEASVPGDAVRFRPEIEPLVRFLEETPRERVIEEAAHRVRRGTSYRDLLTALLLAGVRNIQPRPVGFKFHAVLVVNSAHLASLSAPDSERWLPIFWAIDQFKSSQARDVRQGNWTMAQVDESRIPAGARAKEAFVEAMDRWDVEGADVAVCGLARSVGAHEVFEILCRYGARDFRDIGHKAIYVSNAWRTLQCIGWQHAEPVLRSLAYALLAHEGGNPADRDAVADRDGRRNRELVKEIGEGWQAGTGKEADVTEWLEVLRQASPGQASRGAIAGLNAGLGPGTVWDGIFLMAGEMLMRRPGIVSRHALTTVNALHYAFQNAASDETRRFLLLQAAAFQPLFRTAGGGMRGKLQIDGFDLGALGDPEGAGVDKVFATISEDRGEAAREVMRYLGAGGDVKPLIDQARRWIFLRGTNSHDYKFSSAVLEDFYHVSNGWRAPFLAASVFNLRGSGGDDTELAIRIREALG